MVLSRSNDLVFNDFLQTKLNVCERIFISCSVYTVGDSVRAKARPAAL